MHMVVKKREMKGQPGNKTMDDEENSTGLVQVTRNCSNASSVILWARMIIMTSQLSLVMTTEKQYKYLSYKSCCAYGICQD